MALHVFVANSRTRDNFAIVAHVCIPPGTEVTAVRYTEVTACAPDSNHGRQAFSKREKIGGDKRSETMDRRARKVRCVGT